MCVRSWSPVPLHTRMPFAFFLLTVLLLSACGGPVGDSLLAPSTEDADPSSTAELSEPEDSTPLVSEQPLAVDEADQPLELSIPALGAVMPITPMGWEIVMTDDGMTTEWQVPDDSLGWHVNSAGAGAQGNILISGHQALGAGLLAPLALGEIEIGQELLLTDANGRVFVYRIAELSPPIPLSGATEEEEAQLIALVDEIGAAQLTLMTGWPDFTTTHRIVAQAEFLGEAASE